MTIGKTDRCLLLQDLVELVAMFTLAAPTIMSERLMFNVVEAARPATCDSASELSMMFQLPSGFNDHTSDSLDIRI